ncbi:MAG TPA: TIM barrel protein [Acidobacteriaceae bacterium]|nr:TIM barrel protein [Acidobacteriaceae bacterium]
MSRRTLLLAAAMASAFQSLASDSVEAAPRAGSPDKLKICVFSKHLQWADVKEASAVAKEIGYDGIDLTVRAGGHVEPERVETDLPIAVETIRKAGLEVPMITTDITPATSAKADVVLKAAGRLGIHHYRWGELRYRPGQDIAEQLVDLEPKMRSLAELNQRHQVCGMYHTHSGPGLIGGPIWDLWLMFRELDPRWMGINYDIGHATVEGGYGGWLASSRLVKDYMRGIALKDFLWARNEKGTTHSDPFDKSLGVEGAYVPHWWGIGQGMVNFSGFFSVVKRNAFSGPVQLHFEYPGLGGAQNGNKTLGIPKQQLIDAMRRDLTAVKEQMRKQQLL